VERKLIDLKQPPTSHNSTPPINSKDPKDQILGCLPHDLNENAFLSLG